MLWTLRYRGFDRVWKEVSVDADSRAQAHMKLNAMGYGYVFSFGSRAVRLEDEHGRDGRDEGRVAVNNFFLRGAAR